MTPLWLLPLLLYGSTPLLDVFPEDADGQEAEDDHDASDASRNDDGREAEVRALSVSLVLARVGRHGLGRAGFEPPVALLDDVVADAVDLLVVGDGLEPSLEELVEGRHEVALTRPEVLRQREGRQQRVRCQFPDGEGGQHVPVQAKDLKRLKLLKGDLVDVGQHVVVKVELSEVNKPGKLVAVKLLDVVVVQVELSKVGETGEGVVADGGDVAVVQVELLHCAGPGSFAGRREPGCCRQDGEKWHPWG